jgi:aerobic C4-dicarboxylate transport protein
MSPAPRAAASVPEPAPAPDTADGPARARRARLWHNLTARVLAAVAAGALVGALWPDAGRALKPLGDVFVNLVRMITAPVIFLTVVLGIAGMRDMRRVGRVGGKAFLYFEVVTTVALAIGLLVVNVTRPGAGIDAARLTAGGRAAEAVGRYAAAGEKLDVVDFLVHVVPTSVVGAFAQGEVLQVVFFSVLFGAALGAAGPAAAPLVDSFERLGAVFFRLVGMIMVVAPVGAFGAMAYTVGAFGLRTLLPLGRLMAAVYLTMAVFVFGVLGLVCRAFGFRLWEFLRYIREEIVLVVGTSSSEAALPRMIEKLERYGCARSVVGLVVPAGYSFNLDGTSIYLSMATLFIAQAYGIHLSLGQQLSVLGVLMVTSKGAAGVTGSGFVVLASTLAALRVVPIEGLALLLGVDRFMSEARAVTNLIGNGVATLVVSRSEGAFDDVRRAAAVAARRGPAT